MASNSELDPLEGVAIIGMSGRFPGAPDLERFWQNLVAGVESISAFSEDELLAAGVDPLELAQPGYVRAGAVLTEIERFDAGFFGYSPREAQVLDPQLRLFLESAWQTFEHAGYDPAAIGDRVGVYGGMRLSDYLMLNVYANPEVVAAVGHFQAVLGNDKDYLATQVSYKLNLRGPSVSVQTACSTSLVAVHLAAEALNNRECDFALAGGVTIRLPQVRGYHYQPAGIFSRDGHCRSFDQAASGTVFGNGVGTVLLRRLDDAVAAGDQILAVVRGSAINNDGSQKVGYTAPSVAGQARVIADAMAMAGVTPDEISYVECHGTGTALGDPIEISALDRVFRADGSPELACALGSVKSNLGHLEAAAGIAGLLKTVLMLGHRQLVPSLHFERAGPQSPLPATPFEVCRELGPWSAPFPRKAGVSSFGIGGTNAHVVLEEAPPAEPSGPAREWQLLALSAKSPGALAQAAARLADHLEAHAELSLADVAFTLQVGRRAFPCRQVLVCRQAGEAVAALRAGDPAQVWKATLDDGKAPRVVFLFPGQGSQFPGMAAELYREEASFRADVDRCAAILAPLLGLDVRTFMTRDGEPRDEIAARLAQTSLTQPLLFTLEYALARQWMSWGVRPAALLGHSVGEYVAACLAGVFTLDDALAVVAERGRLIQRLPTGAMTSVEQRAEDLAPLLGPDLEIAAVNAPGLVVAAGPSEAVADLEARLAARGVRCRRLRTSHAFHTAMMEPILGTFAERVRRVALRAPELPVLSNTTGTWLEAAQATDPRYWVEHLRRAVRFDLGVETLLREPNCVFLEVGPGQSLGTLVRQGRGPDGSAAALVLASLPRPDDTTGDLPVLLRSLGRLWLAGVEPAWADQAFQGPGRRRRVALPTYAFERQTYWVEPTGDGRQASNGGLFLSTWRRSPPAAVGSPPDQAGRRWWVMPDRRGLGDAFAGRLGQWGAEVSLVADDEGLAELLARGGRPAAVADFRNLDRLPPDAGPPAGYLRLSNLLAALAAPAPPAEVWCPLPAVHSLAGEPVAGADLAACLGPARFLARQRGAVRLRVIELELVAGTDPFPGPRLERCLAQLERELAAPGEDHHVLWRGDRRWRPDDAPVPLGGRAQGPAKRWRVVPGEGPLTRLVADVPASERGEGGALEAVVYAAEAPADDSPEALAAAFERSIRELGELAAGLGAGDACGRFLVLPEEGSAGRALGPGGLAFAAWLERWAEATLAPAWQTLRVAGWQGPEATPALPFGLLLDRLLGASEAAAWTFGDRPPFRGLSAAVEPVDLELHAPRAEPAARAGLSAAWAAPRSATEQTLAELWQEVLGHPSIGVDDDFFELGGHSLSATRVIARVQEVLGVELPLAALFEHRSVAALARHLEDTLAAGAGAPARIPIPRADRTRDLPLSSAQERLWVLDQLAPGSPAYNLCGALPIVGPLDRRALAAGLAALVERHEILRTVFPSTRGVPSQVIAPPGPLALPWVDLAGLAATARSATTRRLARREAETPFNLELGPVIRGLLVVEEAQRHVLLLSLHHIAADGWSFGVLQRESLALYRSATGEAAPDLPELPIQYADFAAWQRQWLDGDEAARQLAYWRGRLAGAPFELALPLDYPRPPRPSFWGGRLGFKLEPELSAALGELARRHGGSAFMVLLAVFELLLHLETLASDFLVGTNVANRLRPETAPLIGLLVNQVVLRAELAGDPSFEEILARVRTTALGAFSHQELPFDVLVKELQPQRQGDLNPLFQVLFLFQGMELPPLPDEAEAGAEPERVAVRHDLKLEMREEAAGFGGFFEYRHDLFSRRTIERLAARFQALARLAIDHPERGLQSLIADVLAAEADAARRLRQELARDGLAKLKLRLGAAESPEAAP